MIKVRFEPIAKTAETDPYRPIVISNQGEFRTPRCFFREFLSDQRGVEESMYTVGVSKPDISFTTHQLCRRKRVYVVGFRNSWGRLVLDITQAVFWQAHHNGLIRRGDPNTVVSINHLRIFRGDRVSRQPLIRTFAGAEHTWGYLLGQDGSI